MIICLTGYATSGKSTVAQYLIDKHRFVKVSLATPLKRMLSALGLTEEEVNGTLKTVPSQLLCGRTPRHAMQTLGTEWGRDNISPSLWVSLWGQEVDIALAARRSVVCDDLRFRNEFRAAQARTARVWRIDRPGVKGSKHLSESDQDNIIPDEILNNDGTVEQLHQEIEAVLRGTK